MKKQYAQLENNDNFATYLDPILIGDYLYYGLKIQPYKTVEDEDYVNNEGKHVKTIVNEDVPPTYDNLTQLIVDTQNSKQANTDLLSELAQTKLTNAQLLIELAKLKGAK